MPPSVLPNHTCETGRVRVSYNFVQESLRQTSPVGLTLVLLPQVRPPPFGFFYFFYHTGSLWVSRSISPVSGLHGPLFNARRQTQVGFLLVPVIRYVPPQYTTGRSGSGPADGVSGESPDLVCFSRSTENPRFNFVDEGTV